MFIREILYTCLIYTKRKSMSTGNLCTHVMRPGEYTYNKKVGLSYFSRHKRHPNGKGYLSKVSRLTLWTHIHLKPCTSTGTLTRGGYTSLLIYNTNDLSGRSLLYDNILRNLNMLIDYINRVKINTECSSMYELCTDWIEEIDIRLLWGKGLMYSTTVPRMFCLVQFLIRTRSIKICKKLFIRGPRDGSCELETLLDQKFTRCKT